MTTSTRDSRSGGPDRRHPSRRSFAGSRQWVSLSPTMSPHRDRNRQGDRGSSRLPPPACCGRSVKAEQEEIAPGDVLRAAGAGRSTAAQPREADRCDRDSLSDRHRYPRATPGESCWRRPRRRTPRRTTATLVNSAQPAVPFVDLATAHAPEHDHGTTASAEARQSTTSIDAAAPRTACAKPIATYRNAHRNPIAQPQAPHTTANVTRASSAATGHGAAPPIPQPPARCPTQRSASASPPTWSRACSTRPPTSPRSSRPISRQYNAYSTHHRATSTAPRRAAPPTPRTSSPRQSNAIRAVPEANSRWTDTAPGDPRQHPHRCSHGNRRHRVCWSRC